MPAKRVAKPRIKAIPIPISPAWTRKLMAQTAPALPAEGDPEVVGRIDDGGGGRAGKGTAGRVAQEARRVERAGSRELEHLLQSGIQQAGTEGDPQTCDCSCLGWWSSGRAIPFGSWPWSGASLSARPT